MSASGLNDIFLQVKKLNKIEQRTLLQKLSVLVYDPVDTSSTSKLSDISGLGSALWRDVNIDEYIDAERQW